MAMTVLTGVPLWMAAATVVDAGLGSYLLVVGRGAAPSPATCPVPVAHALVVNGAALLAFAALFAVATCCIGLMFYAPHARQSEGVGCLLSCAACVNLVVATAQVALLLWSTVQAFDHGMWAAMNPSPPTTAPLPCGPEYHVLAIYVIVAWVVIATASCCCCACTCMLCSLWWSGELVTNTASAFTTHSKGAWSPWVPRPGGRDHDGAPPSPMPIEVGGTAPWAAARAIAQAAASQAEYGNEEEGGGGDTVGATTPLKRNTA